MTDRAGTTPPYPPFPREGKNAHRSQDQLSPAYTVAAESIATETSIWLLGLAANGTLLLGSFWIARHGLRQPRGLAAALGTAVVFWAATTLGLEILGSSGAIRPESLLGLGMVAMVAGLVVRWFRPAVDRGPVYPPTEKRERGRENGSDAPVAQSLSRPCERAGRGRGPGTITHKAAKGRSSSFILHPSSFSYDALAGLALVLSTALVLGMRSLLLAVKVVSDGPIYHLYFAARWWKAGRLLLVAAPFGENAATYFPANGDLWFTWLITSWGGDRLAKVGQVPFLVLGALAAYGCARLLGASRPASLVATCWFASSTPLLLFSFEPNVDTIFVAGYLLAAYFFLRAICDSSDKYAMVLGALAAGEALGSKAVGVVFIPPLVVLAIGVTLVQRVPAWTKIARTLTVMVVPFVTGGYWYFRNGVLTGNLLYPLEVRLLGRTIWPGWYGPEAMRFSGYYVPVEDWRALVDTLAAVLDPRLVPFWLASLAGAWAVKNRQTGSSRLGTAVFSLLAILNIALYWLCIPYRTQQRFMLQALGLAVVPLALLFDRWRWLRYLGVILLGLHLLTPENWPFPARDDAIPWDLSQAVPNAIPGLIPLFPRYDKAVHGVGPSGSAVSLGLLCGIVLLAMLTVWAWSRISDGARRHWNRALVAALLSVAFLWLGYEDVWNDGKNARITVYPPFANFFIGWQNLERYAGPAGSRVAYAGTNIPYYLLGKALRNEVRYINIDRHRDWLLHDYHREAQARGEGNWPNPRPGWDRARPDYEAWIENLEAEGIQFLVVTRVNPAEGEHNVADSSGFSIERRWADLHPERFEPVYGRTQDDPWFRLYRFRASKMRTGSKVERRDSR